MQTDELTEYLKSLQREECYRVESVLKESEFETTQRVMFVGANGVEQGPFIRKYIARDSGLGSAYERVFEAQRQGRRFLYIPRIADCYTLGEALVVIMEYVQGETLQDVVYRCDPSMQLAADIFPRLCDAVLELHEGFGAPLIHRDLKPSNIMVSCGGLSLIDLGIAREYKGDATTDTHHFGTRAYAPPEQFGFGQTTVRSDVYALGMILYFCLVEQTPDAAVRERGFLDPRIPDPVRLVLLRATEFDPALRYESVRELKRAFCSAVRACGFAGFLSAPFEREDVPPADLSGCVSVSSFTRDSMPHSGKLQQMEVAVKSAFRSAALNVGFVLQKTPLWLGTVWNVVVLAALFLLLVGCSQATFHPNGHDANYPFGFLAFQYLGYCATNFIALAVLLIDKRKMKARFPRVAWPSFPRLGKWVAMYMLISFVAYVVIAQPFVS